MLESIANAVFQIEGVGGEVMMTIFAVLFCTILYLAWLTTAREPLNYQIFLVEMQTWRSSRFIQIVHACVGEMWNVGGSTLAHMRSLAGYPEDEERPQRISDVSIIVQSPETVFEGGLTNQSLGPPLNLHCSLFYQFEIPRNAAAFQRSERYSDTQLAALAAVAIASGSNHLPLFNAYLFGTGEGTPLVGNPVANTRTTERTGPVHRVETNATVTPELEPEASSDYSRADTAPIGDLPITEEPPPASDFSDDVDVEPDESTNVPVCSLHCENDSSDQLRSGNPSEQLGEQLTASGDYQEEIMDWEPSRESQSHTVGVVNKAVVQDQSMVTAGDGGETSSASEDDVIDADVESQSEILDSQTILCDLSSDVESYVKLKFLDDTQKTAPTTFSRSVGDFKQEFFSDALAEGKVVRLIFKGQLLRDDFRSLESYGLHNECIVHCHVSTTPYSQPSSSASERNLLRARRRNTRSDTHSGLPPHGVDATAAAARIPFVGRFLVAVLAAASGFSSGVSTYVALVHAFVRGFSAPPEESEQQRDASQNSGFFAEVYRRVHNGIFAAYSDWEVGGVEAAAEAASRPRPRALCIGDLVLWIFAIQFGCVWAFVWCFPQLCDRVALSLLVLLTLYFIFVVCRHRNPRQVANDAPAPTGSTVGGTPVVL